MIFDTSNYPMAHFSSPPSLRAFSSDLLVSLVTPPMLLGLLGSHVAATALYQLGQISEELFRGDRLPVLSQLEVPEAD